jgi:UDP-glucose 4-epimerase
MTVVITGAAGFIGQALLAQFRAAGVRALGVSRREGPELLRVTDYAESPEGDVLVHLAEDSVRSRVNAAGDSYVAQALATLRALNRRSYRRVVYASSAVLYGDADTHAHRPNDPLQIVDAYTHVKAELEREVLARPAGGVVARIANTHGPGMARETVLGTILGQLGMAGPVRVMAATPVRDYVWIADVVEALFAMAMGAGVGVHNVGTGRGVSVRQLAEATLAQSGESGRAIESEREPERLSHLVVDTTSTFQAFGWRARTRLEDGLSELIRANGRKRP